MAVPAKKHAPKRAEPVKPAQRREAMSSSLKCFQALERLAEEPFELALSELAIDLATPLASTHRIVKTLCDAGFVEQEPLTRRYRLTGKALWAGTGYLRRSEVYRSAFVVLQETAKKCCGLVHLATIDSYMVLYLHTVGSPSALYLYADTGERRPLHCTGLGKAMLAYQRPEVIQHVLAQKLFAMTPKTITKPAELREELARIRQQAFAVDDEENAPGLRCLAVPILDRSGFAVAAFSMSAPAAVLPHAAIQPYIETLKEAALRVSVQMGYRPATNSMQAPMRRA